jgi:hypothetical protein
VLSVLAAVLVSIGLSACGGAGQSTAKEAASVAPTTTSAQAPVADLASHGPPRHSRLTGSPTPGSSKGDLSFRVSNGDNTVPDFGQEAHPSERQLVRARLAGFLKAMGTRDWSKVCTYMDTADLRLAKAWVKNTKEGTSCGSLLAAVGIGSESIQGDALIGHISALRVKGKSAFVLFHGHNASKYVMPMHKEDGVWKMAQLFPTPYPLGVPTTGNP